MGNGQRKFITKGEDDRGWKRERERKENIVSESDEVDYECWLTLGHVPFLPLLLPSTRYGTLCVFAPTRETM